MNGTTEICGCDLQRADGTYDVNAARAVAYETNLIQEKGYRALKEVNRLLNGLVPVRPANVDEGENPRDVLEFYFGVGDTNIASSSDPWATGVNTRDVIIDTTLGRQSLSVVQKAGGSLLCDNRSVSMLAGHDVRRGTMQVLPDIKSPCICVWDFARVDDFLGYLQALRSAMPVEMETIKERVLLRELVSRSKYNVSESGANEPVFTEGYFPHEPAGGPTISTFRKIRDRHKRMGHVGNIRVPISGPALQSMMVSYYAACGLQHQVQNWISGDFPASWANEGRWVFEDIEFAAQSTPIKGIMVKVASNRYEFIPLSTRIWRAGTGAGVSYDYDERYDKPVFNLNGIDYPVYEVSPVVSQQAFYQQPLRMRGVGVEGVNDDGTMWNGTSIRTIGGAYIPDNTKQSKFRWELSNAFRLVPRKPYLSSFVLFRSPDYIRHPNQIGLNFGQATVSAAPYYIGSGRQPDATSAADRRAGLYPQDPAPGSASEICSDTANTAGVFRTPCAGVVDETASTITLVVERINGSSGAASIAWATANGTGDSTTDYTAGSGTLSWADGEYGAKTITVALKAGARHGKTFLVNFSGVTGASLISNGCTSATLTINRPAYSYSLDAGLTGTMNSMVVDGGALSLPGFSYAATGAGALALQNDLNDFLAANYGGAAVVSYNSGWSIVITGSRRIFTSATSASGTGNYTQS